MTHITERFFVMIFPLWQFVCLANLVSANLDPRGFPLFTQLFALYLSFVWGNKFKKLPLQPEYR